MARLGSQMLKGFYPFPLHLIPHVTKYLSIQNPERTILLDPCAGKGDALLELGNNLRLPISNLCANELDQERYDICIAKGLTTVSGDALSEVHFPVCSILWLNPPYDYDIRSGGRLERTFLTLAKNLPYGGVLAFIVPLSILERKEFQMFPQEFKNIRILKFPDVDSRFGQCVVLARRMPGKRAGEVRNWQMMLQSPLPMEDAPDDVYPVPAVPSLDPLKFYSARLSQSAIAALCLRKELLIAHELPKRKVDNRIHTLMPLRSGHQALSLATGALDGVYIDPVTKNTLVILGKTETAVQEVEEVEENVTRKVLVAPQPEVLAWDLSASKAQGQPVFYEFR